MHWGQSWVLSSLCRLLSANPLAFLSLSASYYLGSGLLVSPLPSFLCLFSSLPTITSFSVSSLPSLMQQMCFLLYSPHTSQSLPLPSHGHKWPISSASVCKCNNLFSSGMSSDLTLGSPSLSSCVSTPPSQLLFSKLYQAALEA